MNSNINSRNMDRDAYGANGDYNTRMYGDNMGDMGNNNYDSAGMMGGIFFTMLILFYIVIFFLLPFYMIAVTDASIKRKYWWILGMVLPVVNFVCIPIYYFTKLEKMPKASHHEHTAHTA